MFEYDKNKDTVKVDNQIFILDLDNLADAKNLGKYLYDKKNFEDIAKLVKELDYDGYVEALFSFIPPYDSLKIIIDYKLKLYFAYNFLMYLDKKEIYDILDYAAKKNFGGYILADYINKYTHNLASWFVFDKEKNKQLYYNIKKLIGKKKRAMQGFLKDVLGENDALDILPLLTDELELINATTYYYIKSDYVKRYLINPEYLIKAKYFKNNPLQEIDIISKLVFNVDFMKKYFSSFKNYFKVDLEDYAKAKVSAKFYIIAYHGEDAVIDYCKKNGIEDYYAYMVKASFRELVDEYFIKKNIKKPLSFYLYRINKDYDAKACSNILDNLYKLKTIDEYYGLIQVILSKADKKFVKDNVDVIEGIYDIRKIYTSNSFFNTMVDVDITFFTKYPFFNNPKTKMIYDFVQG